MDPVCFHIGQRPIYWYGVLVACAFLAAVAHWNALARREKRPAGFGSELGFWVMLCGIVGARIAYVAANWALFRAEPLEILRIDRGGLVYYGGFLGAAAGLAVLARVRREPVLRLADFAVTGLPLGHALGRIGCFLNSCCYGSPTALPWCVHAHDACRHPTQLYEAALNFALYGLLLRFFLRRTTDGRTLALYLLLYPPARFLVEFLRGDERLRWLGVDVAQLLSLFLLVAGAALWAATRRRTAE
jgi:phosphatidylglycerol---prolipoprotein diacylglyceryl transferase